MLENGEKCSVESRLRLYVLKTTTDMRKTKWKYSVKSMQRERLPAIVDRGVWEKLTKGQAVQGDIA